MASPYLEKPTRSLEEVLDSRPRDEDLEDVIRQVVARCHRSGLGPHEQLNRAAMVALKLQPELSALDALALVHRVTRKHRD